MSRDRSVVGASPLAAGAEMESRRAEYINPAPVAEILHEQLDYLIEHARRSCAPGCEECVRLQQVQGWLLIPFRRVRGSRRSGRAA